MLARAFASAPICAASRNRFIPQHITWFLTNVRWVDFMRVGSADFTDLELRLSVDSAGWCVAVAEFSAQGAPATPLTNRPRLAPTADRAARPGHTVLSRPRQSRHARGRGTPGAPHGHEHEHDHESEDGRPRIAFVGAGRVGAALAVAFARAGWDVTAVASRDETRRRRFQHLVPGARAFQDAQAVLDEADLIFITVPDDAIADVAGSLHLYSGQALVHTSGALPASILAPAMAAGTNSGGFHPLVAFADHDQALADLPGSTIAVEGDESLMPLLAEMAESIGAKPVTLPEGGKTAYHAAAMMAAGGLVGLLDAIAAVAAVAGLDEKMAMSVYAPLARQALANSERLGIAGALTGPLLRGDIGTLKSHLSVLKEHAPGALPLYVEVARREVAIAVRRGELAPERAREIEELLASANRLTPTRDVPLRPETKSLTFGPMRSSHAVIRGERPITRFATQTAHRRAAHLGIRRTTPARLAQSPADSLATKPLVAIRSAARGHLGITKATRHRLAGASKTEISAMHRADAIVWALTPYSVPHRTRPRSATPWRG